MSAETGFETDPHKAAWLAAAARGRADQAGGAACLTLPTAAVEPPQDRPPPPAYGSPATGGCDDVEALYAPRDGQVRAVTPGLPSSAAAAHKAAMAAFPRPACPKCGAHPDGLGGAAEAVPWLGLTYRLHPCGCPVSVGWAGGYMREMSRRLAGKPPLPVSPTKEPPLNPAAHEHLFPKGLGKPQIGQLPDSVAVYLPDGSTYRFYEFDDAQRFVNDYIQRQVALAACLKLAKAEPLGTIALQDMFEEYGGQMVSVSPAKAAKPALQTLPKVAAAPEKAKPTPYFNLDMLADRLTAYILAEVRAGRPQDANAAGFSLTPVALEELSKWDCRVLADLVAMHLRQAGREAANKYMSEVRSLNPFFNAVLVPRIAFLEKGGKSAEATTVLAAVAKELADHQATAERVGASLIELEKNSQFVHNVFQYTISSENKHLAGERKQAAASSMRAFLEAGEPLSDDAAKFVAVFLESTNQAYIDKLNGKQPGQSAVPAAVPDGVRKLVERASAEEVERAKRVRFAQGLTRVRRSVRPAHPRQPDLPPPDGGG